MNPDIKAIEIKNLINEKDGIEVKQQLITDSTGKMLNDDDIMSTKSLPEVIIA